MLYGSLAFDGESYISFQNVVKRGNYKLPRKLDKLVEGLLMVCLAEKVD